MTSWDSPSLVEASWANSSRKKVKLVVSKFRYPATSVLIFSRAEAKETKHSAYFTETKPRKDKLLTLSFLIHITENCWCFHPNGYSCRLVFAIHTGLFLVCVNIEYAQANSFVAVLMVDFSPFSAVLVNCQLYRLNNITCFFSCWQMCSCSIHSSDDISFSCSYVQRLSVVFLSGTWYPSGWIKRIFALSDVLILLTFVF